ncbi:DUF7453 family protein [Coleofasciculus sp. G2-EDA-02]|uniref:DUF7453 family protein n=1 Tax=Coleofasciculus sp. G2-EDA-02 TaxID=3069529 RepID=UPI0032F52094
MKPPTIYHLSATAVGVTLSLLAMGNAEAYTFSRIFDDSGPYNLSSNLPAINNQGTVAFEARLDLDQYPLPSYPDDRYYRDVIFTGDGQSLNRITQRMGTFNFKDINDSHTVAFTEQISSPRFPQYNLFTTNGDGFTTINQRPSPSGYTYDFGDVTINNEGSVFFHELYFGVFTSDGVNRTTIAERSGALEYFSGTLALNNKGNVAFGAYFDDWGSGIFTGNGDSTTLIADTNGLFRNFGTLSLNDSDTLAFAASLDDGSAGIFTSSNGSITTIADTSGLFSGFSNAAINNNGDVAFGAGLDTGESGIFTGTDPVADKVITIGDPLFGSTVTSLRFSNKGFNDAGQFAFFAELADGSSGIFRADPDPNAVVFDWGGTVAQPIPATLKPIEIDDFSGEETLIDYDSDPNSYSCFGDTWPPSCQLDGVIHIGFFGYIDSLSVLHTNNITPPDLRFHWTNQLSVIFPEPQNRLGFGFALSQYDDFYLEAPIDQEFLANAVTVKLFDAAENLLGTLSGDAKQDPLFLGGFLGVESTVPFLRAEIIFTTNSRDRALDNLRYEFVTLPEPATVPEHATGLGLLVMSAIGAGSALRHKQK